MSCFIRVRQARVLGKPFLVSKYGHRVSPAFLFFCMHPAHHAKTVSSADLTACGNGTPGKSPNKALGQVSAGFVLHEITFVPEQSSSEGGLEFP